MSFENEYQEDEIRDSMTEDMPTEFVIYPMKVFDVNEFEGIANYGDVPIKVSIQYGIGKTLIGFHGIDEE